MDISTPMELEPQRKTVQLDDEQLKAVTDSCNLVNRVVAVSGSAGTGKTTVLEEIYMRLSAAGYAVALCSPTGKAAKRITEVTGIFAQTVHKLLEYTSPGDPDPRTGKPVEFSYPKRTRQNPLEYDVVLVDEFAMVAQEQNDALFAALPNKGCIRVFGDENQLKPIEEGHEWGKPHPPTPFEQLLRKFPATRLTKVYRQAEDSGILMNLQSILLGRMPTNNNQWTMKFTDAPTDALIQFLKDERDKGISYAVPENQVITVQNKGWIGTVNLNIIMQKMYNNTDNAHSIDIPRHKWVEGIGKEKGGVIKVSVGDKVMWTRNNPNLGLMNGESGVLTEITNDGELAVDFGDKVAIIPPLMSVLTKYGKIVQVDPRKDLDLGYAITTHKSQGSEYKRGVYIINKSTMFMQSRRNFYTGASRMREHLQLITDQMSLRTSLNKKESA